MKKLLIAAFFVFTYILVRDLDAETECLTAGCQSESSYGYQHGRGI